MFEKVNIFRIVKEHFGTLVNVQTKRTNWYDIATFYILPMTLSVSLYIYSVTPTPSVINIVVTSLSIFAALLFNLLVVILAYPNTPTPPRVDQNVRVEYIREIYVNIAYAILVALLTIIFCVVLLALEPNQQVQQPDWVNHAYKLTAMITQFSFLNFILTLFMILKRVHILFYKEIYKG